MADYTNKLYIAGTDIIDIIKSEKAESAKVADSATKATQDASGNVITSTYATKSEVTSGLAGKQPVGDYATKSELTSGLAGKANTSHTHTIANVTNLQTTLNTITGKIPTKTSQLSNDSGFLTTHPTISVAAKTLDSGSAATVTKSGTDEAPVFTFGIPKGAKGDRGDTGPRGPQGPAGSSGPTPNAYVTKSWKSDTNWYKKWSNGLIEQGGYIDVVGGSLDNLPVNLPIPFRNTIYFAWYDLPVGRPHIYKKEVSTVYFYKGEINNSRFSWYACGF